MLLGIWILYKKLFCENNITEMWNEVKTSLDNKAQIFFLCLTIALVPLNFYLEALKWKVQIKPIEKISKWKSFISIFTGITAGMFFPNRMGNFLGRVFMLEKCDRIKASLMTISGGMAQMIATVSLGMIAAIFFIKKNYVLCCIAAFIIISLLLLMYFNIHIIKHLMFLIPKKYKDKLKEYFEVFSLYNKKELSIILLLSFLRYFLYTFQFVLLLWTFKVPLSYINAMIPVSLTYLMMMIVPFITITEIAVRGSVSLVIFEKWLLINNISDSFGMMVFSANSLLWILNIGIPAVIGLFLTYKLNLFRNKNEL